MTYFKNIHIHKLFLTMIDNTFGSEIASGKGQSNQMMEV